MFVAGPPATTIDATRRDGMQLRLLGMVEAEVRGRRIALGPRKQRLVLAVLALEVNRPVSIERLVEVAWAPAPPRTAEHAIRACASGLRTALASPSWTRCWTRRTAGSPWRSR